MRFSCEALKAEISAFKAQCIPTSSELLQRGSRHVGVDVRYGSLADITAIRAGRLRK
jgi:hypothetical protein